MNFITKYKTKLYLISLLSTAILLSILALVILNFHKTSFYKGINSTFGGIIIEINDDGFVMQTKSGKREVILIKPNTNIYKGNNYIYKDGLSIGEYVLVAGNLKSSGVVDAKVLRILKNK